MRYDCDQIVKVDNEGPHYCNRAATHYICVESDGIWRRVENLCTQHKNIVMQDPYTASCYQCWPISKNQNEVYE